MISCQRCGTEGPDGFRFCGSCGAELHASDEPRESRKVVTALFCDVADSTALGEALDPEVLRHVINRYFADMRKAIERHGGTVEKFIGDAVMAVFGIPRVREDDALRAVRAAVEIRERLPILAEEVGVSLRVRTGINTGLVLMSGGENLAIGDAVNVAARLEQAAAPDEIVLGQRTLALVRDAVEVESLAPLAAKGKSEPLRAYRLLRVDPVAPGVARRLDAPLVGRQSELGVLQDALQRSVRERSCRLLTVLGAAGIGKSRLVAELIAGANATTVLQGRCLPYGEGITFWPLMEALRPIGEAASVTLTHLTRGGVAVPDELFWEVRRLLESLALERPLILHVDDLQWAESMLLELLEHVADLSRSAPILLVCTARPELLESRPAWGVGKLNASTILLEPLDRAASAQLLDQLDEGLDADLQTRLIATSDGNPLFLEEMVALARDQGSVVVPPTIQVLLSARLESLPTDERDLLERGSIEGEVFHRRAVCALAEHHPAAVERRLAELVRKDLIRPHPVNLRDDDAFRFRHLLIRDAAYDGLTMAARTKLHERFATWLEDTGPHLPELDEIAGWHLEQTVRYQRDLGRRPDDAVATRATRHLLLAGRRAAERFDTSAAVNLLRRAHGLAFADEPLAATAGVELAEQLVAMGDFAAADELLEAAEQTPLVATRAELIRLQWLVHARPEEATAAALGSLPDLIERLTLAGDDRGLVKAHLAMVTPHWVAGRATAAVSEARRAVDHATAAGDEQLRARAQGQYITLIMFDRTPASVIARELDAIERDRPGLLLTVLIRQMRGWLCRLAGEFDEARRIWELSRQGLEAMGRQLHAASYLEMLADIEVAAGDHAAALAALSRADTLLQAAGDRSFRSTIQAYLAEAHERLGDRAAAEAAVELAEQMSAPDDAVNFALTHGVRARLALAADDLEAAERWARSALERALTTEFPLDQARQRINLADVMQEIDRRDVAESETRLALELFELKEDRPGAAAARARLARLRR